MKKIILSLFLLFMCQAAALAATIKVQSQSDFTTENPPETLTVKAVTDLVLDDGFLIINEGYTLKGDIVDVSSPKRLKRDASFAFILKEYTDNNGQTHTVDSLVKGKFTTKFDYKSAAKSAALGVGSYFVKGLSSAYAAVEGAVKNEEGNRFKSSAISVYESTPISYVEKGEDIVIKKNQIFILNFKVKDEKDEPNYEYTVPEKTVNNWVSETKKENSEENSTPTKDEKVLLEVQPENTSDAILSQKGSDDFAKTYKNTVSQTGVAQSDKDNIPQQYNSQTQLNIEDQRINNSTSVEHLEKVLKSTYPTYTPAQIPTESLAPLELPFSDY